MRMIYWYSCSPACTMYNVMTVFWYWSDVSKLLFGQWNRPISLGNVVHIQINWTLSSFGFCLCLFFVIVLSSFKIYFVLFVIPSLHFEQIFNALHRTTMKWLCGNWTLCWRFFFHSFLFFLFQFIFITMKTDED